MLRQKNGFNFLTLVKLIWQLKSLSNNESKDYLRFSMLYEMNVLYDIRGLVIFN